MNRQEFCQIIADIRKQSTIKMKDICFQMGVMPTAIYRLEKGSNNFEMGNMMSYIKALQHILVIENGQHITAMQGVTIIQIITQINATIAIIVFRY